MATFLQIGLLEHFGPLFVVLLIFLIVFGLLEYIKAFGSDKKGLHGIIAIVIALLFLISKAATVMVKTLVPWFIVLVIFIFFVMFVVRMFGVQEKHMFELIKDTNVYPWVIIFSVIILFLALGNAFGQSLLEQREPAENGVNYTAHDNGASNTGTYIPSTPITPGQGTTDTSDFSANLIHTITHPKVLGLMFIFVVAMFALLFLTKPVSPLD